LSWPQTMILPISNSKAARITGASHKFPDHWPTFCELIYKYMFLKLISLLKLVLHLNTASFFQNRYECIFSNFSKFCSSVKHLINWKISILYYSRYLDFNIYYASNICVWSVPAMW
jgi:hypothetical protein